MSVPGFRLDGRRALITGASSGLGLHFADVLAAAGAEVILAARRVERLQEETRRLCDTGARAHCVALDVTDGTSVREAFEHAESLAGGAVDILINNAGISGRSFFLNVEEDEWDSVVDTNLKGAYLVAREAAKRLVAAQKPGSIINIASILGLRVTGAVSPYCASKGGLIQLTKAMALELARHGIRVNAIAPGYIETDMNADFWSTEQGKKMLARIPQRRLGRAQELDGPLLLLASEAGTYMTGATIEVDGGHLCSAL
jgi:NAD(P)-dependent dehydrogenase (short-subunit alcohol dehydrogenase family)